MNRISNLIMSFHLLQVTDDDGVKVACEQRITAPAQPAAEADVDGRLNFKWDGKQHAE